MAEAARRVRAFRARTMDEALERVRQVCGPNAIILQARYIHERRWWGGAVERAEVIAGLEKSNTKSNIQFATMPQTAPRLDAENNNSKLALEVAELKTAVGELLGRKPAACNIHLSELKSKLSNQGLPDDLIDGLLKRVESILPNITDSAQASSTLEQLITKLIPASGPVKLAEGRAARIILVGPTGVGKTTTIAKLAAHFRVREHRTVGLVAADTYRIAAVDQLRRYAELLGSEVRIARGAEEMAGAVDALSGNDVVFIDTAGRSHRDTLRMNELRTLIKAVNPDEVHLVLSLAADRDSVFKAIDKFAPLGANRLIITKLDEAERGGLLLQASARAEIPVAYLTTGQEVPDDIEQAHPATLARVVMDGPESLASRELNMRRSA